MTVSNEFQPGPLDREALFYVAGHNGLVGSAIWRNLSLRDSKTFWAEDPQSLT